MTESVVRDQTLLGAIGSAAKAGAGFIADLVARIVSGIQGAVIAPLALAFGCQAPDSDASSKPAPPPAVSRPAPIDASVETEPKQLGLFNITFYYVVGEEEVMAKAKKREPANDNHGLDQELAAVTPSDTVTLYQEKNCEPIAEVSREFAHQLRVQGTGKLRDGRVLNIWSRCKCEHSPCFKVIPHKWGTAGNLQPLQPFRTVAVDPKVIKLGSLLYVPLLEGRLMPGRAPWGGFVHDGCVVADDVGGGIKGRQLDLFVGRRGWFLGMSGSRSSHAWARHVPVFDGRKICERKGRKVARKSGAI